MSDEPTTQAKLRMLAAAIATEDEIVDRQLIVKDLLEAADEIERLRQQLSDQAAM